MPSPPRLRPYQVHDPRKIDAAFGGGRRVVHQAPTVSGKTVLFTEHIGYEVADGGRVVLGHRDEIVMQISQAFCVRSVSVTASSRPATPRPDAAFKRQAS